MADLILRPSTLVEGKPWALQLRYHDCVGPTDYHTITRVSEDAARAIVDAGAPFFLFGDPPETPAMPNEQTGGTWSAPVRLTEKMINRMIGAGPWGDLTRDELADLLRAAWAEARYAAPTTTGGDHG